MNLQLSMSKGLIINHGLNNTFKTKHPSQSKQCVFNRFGIRMEECIQGDAIPLQLLLPVKLTLSRYSRPGWFL